MPTSIKEVKLNPLACFQCGICTGGCFSARYTQLNIRRLIESLALDEDIRDDGTLWACSTCYQCQDRCPQGIPLVDIIFKLRESRFRDGKVLENYRGVLSNLVTTGHIAPIDKDTRKKRKELGLEEMAETVQKYPHAVDELKILMDALGISKLVGR